MWLEMRSVSAVTDVVSVCGWSCGQCLRLVLVYFHQKKVLVPGIRTAVENPNRNRELTATVVRSLEKSLRNYKGKIPKGIVKETFGGCCG